VKERARFWQRWLIAVTLGVALFGLTLVIAPALGRQVFGLLIYRSPSGIAELGGSATPYISLVHGVLGAVMFGWAAALLLVVLGPFRRGAREGWTIIAVSVAAWFVPDTIFSLWTGFWPNAVLNLVFAALFAIPLAATRRSFLGRRA
jgi:hypothetical protein